MAAGTNTLSIVIPSHNDLYLHRTIASLLDNSEGEIEIVVVLDGYDPTSPIIGDPRVRIIRHGRNLGMREAINTGVAASRGQYIMRVDEHCMFSPGYDRLLLEEIEDNWIVTPRRYFLDPVKWEVIGDKFIDYEKLLIITKPSGRRKFSAVEWWSRGRERRHLSIDETMAMQGSCWVMSRKWWDSVIVRLDSEGYGTLYQDTTEMLFKTWAAGGKLMLNKNTWYAHKHRNFNRTHDYPGELADASFRFALEKHGEEYERVRAKWMI
jgi:glycosyltransferase involved in cell wall biosynthesis